MAEKEIAFEIVTPQKIIFSEPVYSLIVPGADGLLGVLPGHAPLVTKLAVGIVEIEQPNSTCVRAFIAGGFMEVMNNKVVLLASIAEMGCDIDVDRAKRAKERAEERLSRRGQGEVDVARAEYALQRALARIRTVS